MDATAKTIGFLRTLTLDGLLTSDEVWSLGRFFNDHPECVNSWPGDLLAPMLASAFDDGRLSDEEMVVLAETISSIEAEWRAKNPLSPEEEEEMQEISVHPALIPVLEARFEMDSTKQDETFVVDLAEHACTCPDWAPRKSLPAANPGKCCKHVAHAFVRTGKVFEPWFQALLDDCFAHARGTDPSANWLLLETDERKRALIGGGAERWCTVFAPGSLGYGTYAFHSGENQWSYGDAPKRSRLIERAIRDHLCLVSA